LRLAVCAIFKNEAPFLEEWLAWHRVIGVSHFFLYDNGSTDGGADLIRGAADITLSDWPRRPGQLAAYRDVIAHHARRYDWVAFIDVDEFIHPLEDDTVWPALARADGFSAMLVHWRVFGPSGWDHRPPGLVLENYIQRSPDDDAGNRHVKTIVRGADVLDAGINPHEFATSGPVCNAAGQAVPNIAIQTTACHQHLVINHYQSRSRQDWAEKLARGSAMIEQAGPRYPPETIEVYAALSTVEDRAIQRFLPAVRARLRQDVWQQHGGGVWLRQDGRGMVQPTPHGWIAALRGKAARLNDPDYLCDISGRFWLFADAATACAACDAALTR
jgi:Glycosyl transferase family 2